MKKKILVACLCVALAVLTIAGTTLAYLTSKDTVTNTFTVGNVKIELKETTTDYKMIPGQAIAKDPKVTVKDGSEACWLFIKIEESSALKNYISYAVNTTDWTKLQDGVYYKEIDTTTAATGATYSVLDGDKVSVLDSVTQKMMDDLQTEGATQPTLTFTAYAIQKAGFTTAAAAWAEVSKTAT